MAKAYNGGFTASTGFKRTDASPLDDSEIVEFLADLTNGTINKPYPMMEVGVLEDLQYYSWNGGDITLMASWIPRGANGALNAAITTNGTVPALVTPITAAQIRTLIGAGTMTEFTLALENIAQAFVRNGDTLNFAAGNAMDVVHSVSGNVDTLTISFERSVTESATGGSVPLRTSTGLLVATGVAIAGGSNPLFILRGDGSVSAITKAEIDNLGINATQLSGRILNFAPAGNTVAGRDNDGYLNSLLKLVRAPETTTQALSNTVTMGVPGANNYHELKNVPKYLFKEYLFESTDTSFAQLPVTASVTFTTLSFRRKDGRVLIKGTWTGNSTGSNTTIANLPAGSRPLVEEFTSCHRSNQEMIPIKIDPNGDIKIGTHVTGQDYSMTIEFIIDKTL